MPDSRLDDDQKDLFSEDTQIEEPGDGSPDLGEPDDPIDDEDLPLRSVDLPRLEAESERGKGLNRTTLIMVGSAVIAVFILTWYIYQHYAPTPEAPPATSLIDEKLDAASGAPEQDQPAGERAAETGAPVSNRETAEQSGATFAAHAELVKQYAEAEKRIAQLEAQLAARPSEGPGEAGTPAVGAKTASRTEEEYQALKSEGEAERLRHRQDVAELEARLRDTEDELKSTRDRFARVETQRTAALEQNRMLETDRDELRTELQSMAEKLASLEKDLERREADLDALANASSSRQTEESRALQQIMSRHAREMEEEQQLRREKEAEIARLNKLVETLTAEERRRQESRAERFADVESAPVTVTPPGRSTGAESVPPRVISRREPDYPVNARRYRIEGTVVLKVLVGEDGKVLETRVLQSPAGGKLLESAAVDAVAQWEFTPGLSEGRPVRMWREVSVKFEL